MQTSTDFSKYTLHSKKWTIQKTYLQNWINIYYWPKNSGTALQHRFKDWWTVLWPIGRYSSLLSADIPYVNCLWADKPSLLAASRIQMKYLSWASTRWRIRTNQITTHTEAPIKLAVKCRINCLIKIIVHKLIMTLKTNHDYIRRWPQNWALIRIGMLWLC